MSQVKVIHYNPVTGERREEWVEASTLPPDDPAPIQETLEEKVARLEMELDKLREGQST